MKKSSLKKPSDKKDVFGAFPSDFPIIKHTFSSVFYLIYYTFSSDLFPLGNEFLHVKQILCVLVYFMCFYLRFSFSSTTFTFRMAQ